MDGRGHSLDNAFFERLWRSVKYEEAYLREYGDLPVARHHLSVYFEFYKHRRNTALSLTKHRPRPTANHSARKPHEPNHSDRALASSSDEVFRPIP